MATTVATLLPRAKRRFGLDGSTDDALLSNAFLIDEINVILQEAAQAADGWQEEFTINLATDANHALSGRVIRILDGTLRVDYDGSGQYLTLPELAEERELRACYGALEGVASGQPRYYYTQRGLTADVMLNLMLFPKSDAARTNGVKFRAAVYPTALTLTTDNLPVQLGEERFFLSGLALAMVRAQRHLGRDDGLPLAQVLAAEWERDLAAWADVIEDGSRGDSRRLHHVEDYY